MKTVLLLLVLLLTSLNLLAQEPPLPPEPPSPNERQELVLFPEKEAQFPQGVDSLMNFIRVNLKFPDSLQEGGRMYVRFVIEKDGSISNFEFVKSLGREYEIEIRKLFLSMPKWVPAENHGKKVRSSMALPISFIVTR